MEPSPYLILSAADAPLTAVIDVLTGQELYSLAAEVERLRPLISRTSLSSRTVLRLSRGQFTRWTRHALAALHAYAVKIQLPASRRELLAGWPALARASNQRRTRLRNAGWSCLVVETAKGLRAEAYERGRQRVDLHLAKGDTTCGYSCLAKMLLILGARQLVLEGPAALIILARPQFESAGLTVRASVVLTPYLAKALVGDVSDFDV